MWPGNGCGRSALTARCLRADSALRPDLLLVYASAYVCVSAYVYVCMRVTVRWCVCGNPLNYA